MKIAFVFDEFESGGIERTGCDYIRLLSRKGIDIDVYNLHPGKHAAASGLPKNVRFYEASFSRLFCPELYNYGVQNWWWGKYAYPAVYLAAELFLLLRKRIIPRKEYDYAVAFSGHINDITFVTSELVKARQKVCWCHGSLLSYLAVCDAYAILYKKIDKIVTLSEQGIQYAYAGHKWLYEKKIKNIYNPVLIQRKKLDKSHVSRLKEKHGDFILMVIRFMPPKDPWTAMKAVLELKQRGLSKKIVFVGNGPMLDECRIYAKEHQINDLCVFEGARKDVQDYIAASHINLLSSRWEGLPTVIAEAMAFQKPCIMTECDGGEISGSGKYCLLARTGDSTALADWMEKLYQDDNFYKERAMLAKQRFKDFEPEGIIRSLMDFLKE